MGIVHSAIAILQSSHRDLQTVVNRRVTLALASIACQWCYDEHLLLCDVHAVTMTPTRSGQGRRAKKAQAETGRFMMLLASASVPFRPLCFRPVKQRPDGEISADNSSAA